MNKFNRFKNDKNKPLHFVGKQIRAQKILLIDGEENKVISITEALVIAAQANLDLVQFSQGDVPSCRIIDYSKFKYELHKKEKLQKKKQRDSIIKIKEIKFRPSTGIEDLKVKANNAIKNLDDGYRIKIIVIFKGRELSYKDLGFITLNKFISLIPDFQLLEEPSLSGKFLAVTGMRKNDNNG